MAEKLADLTPDQLKTLNDFDLLIRPVVIQMFKAIAQAQATVDQYNGTVVQVISLLDGTEQLPSTNGLQGSTLFAESDWGYMTSYMQNLLTWWNANMVDSGQMVLWTKAAGSINLAG